MPRQPPHARNSLAAGSQNGWRLLQGLLFSSLISLLAYRRRSLSRSGVAGAIATGTATFGCGGWSWGLSLIYFFISSSLFSQWRVQEKTHTAADKFSKGSQRDITQVAANGGVATLLAVARALISLPSLQATLQAGYVGALATTTADTWATEFGVLSSLPPRLVTTGRPVTPGTSGGITLPGTLAGALGAFSLGLVFWLLNRCSRQLASLPGIALVSGCSGSLTDSLLGATVQAMNYCPICRQETERRLHNCGTLTTPLRGIPWLNNDCVNFLATLCGALTAMLLHTMLARSKTGKDNRHEQGARHANIRSVHQPHMATGASRRSRSPGHRRL